MAAILLVSADPSLDGAYCAALSGRGHAVVCVSGTAEAIRVLFTFRVQAIILDSRLCGCCDDFRRWLRGDAERAAVPVLYLVPPAALDLDIAPVPGFRPQLDTVLPRPFTVGELTGALDTLLRPPRREGFEEVVTAGPFSVNVQRRLLSAGDRSIPLTPIEARLLRYLMGRPGLPVGTEELLVSVWGYYPGTGGPEVVRAHVRNLRRKLQQVAPGRDVLLTIPRLGYRFIGDAAEGPA